MQFGSIENIAAYGEDAATKAKITELEGKKIGSGMP